MTTKEIGDFGERAVCRYLKKRGMKIVERNFRTRAGELDIIARDGDVTVFIEVKTRKTRDFGNPGEFVGAVKRDKIIATALYYLGGDDEEMRFDVAEVLYRTRFGMPYVSEINYIENAF